MCDVAAGGLVLGMIGTGLQFGEQLEQGANSKKEALQNARLARQAAVDAEMRGAQEAGRARQSTTELIARQRTAYFASGVDATEGTAANVIAATRAQGEHEARLLENNAAREAWGYRRFGVKWGQQAAIESGRTASRAAGTFLTGAGNALGGYANYRATSSSSSAAKSGGQLAAAGSIQDKKAGGY